VLRLQVQPTAWRFCPVECFYYDEKMLYIDPADCIDCEACVPECPSRPSSPRPTCRPSGRVFTPLNAERSTALRPAATATSPKRAIRQEGPECKKKA